MMPRQFRVAIMRVEDRQNCDKCGHVFGDDEGGAIIWDKILRTYEKLCSPCMRQIALF